MLSSVTWTGNASDNQWNSGGNWSTGTVPGSSDSVTINTSPNTTIHVGAGNVSIHDVSSNAALDIESGATFSASTIQASSNLILDGGTIVGPTISTSGGASVELTSAGGTLNGVDIAAGTLVDGTQVANPAVTITNGMTVDGAINLGGATSTATVTFLGTETLTGSGTFNLTAVDASVTDASNPSSPATLTIESGLTLNVGNGFLSAASSDASIVNDAPLTAVTPGATFSVTGGAQGSVTESGAIDVENGASLSLGGLTGDVAGVNVTGSGSLLVLDGSYDLSQNLSITSGSTLSLYGNWTLLSGVTLLSIDVTLNAGDGNNPWQNDGFLNQTNTNVYLGGDFTTDDIGSFERTGGLTYVIGTFDNRGSTINLSPASGTVDLAGGTILGGTITTSAGINLLLTPAGGTLDGVTIATGSIVDGTQAADAQATIADGLTLNGTIELGSSTTSGQLNIVGNQSVTGTGVITFAGTGNSLSVSNATVSIGSSISLEGQAGSVLGFSGAGIFDSAATITGGTLNVANGTTLDLSGTLESATVDGDFQVDGDRSVTIENGLTLNGTTTLGSSSNWGLLNFAGGGSPTLGGTGTIVFGASGPNAIALGNGGTLTIGSGITVEGKSGFVGYDPQFGASFNQVSVVDEGTIEANASGALIQVLASNLSFSGLSSVDNGGTLFVEGTISNSGGSVALDGSGGSFVFDTTIVGGTVKETNGATLQLDTGTLDGVTVDGNLEVNGERGVTIEDGLTLNGTATLGGSGANNWGYLTFSGNQTLGGTGTIVFNGPGPYDALTLPNGGTLTIGSGITVEGANGYIGYDPQFGGPLNSMNVVNQGTILANVSGSTLTVNAGGTSDQSTGTLEALNGSTLTLVGNNWLDSGTNFTDASSTLVLSAAFANSGNTLTLTGSGTFEGSPSVTGGTMDVGSSTPFQLDNGTLDGVTVDGNLEVNGERGVTIEDGLTLNGTATLGGSGANNWGYLTFSGNQTLGGTGTIVFNGPGPYNALTLPNGGTLIIGSGITVEGANGYIGDDPQFGGPLNSMNVVNQGTILANVSGSTLVLNAGSWLNTGVLRVDSGGILVLAATYTNTGGTLSLDGSDGTFFFDGSIVGGTVSEADGATLLLDSGTLDGVVVDGDLQVEGEHGVTIQDGLTLNGTATLGGSGANNWGYFTFSGNQTLAGTGTIVFNGPGPYNALTLPYGGTLTIGSGITVEGANGYIGYDPQFGGPISSMSIVNQGTILANVSGSTLVLNAGSWLNTGVLRVDSGGILVLAATYTNTGGTLSLDGSDGTFFFDGSIVGGTVSEADGATLLLDSGTLDGVVVDGDLQVEGEHGVTIQDGLTLNGTATLGGSGANNWGYFTFSGNQTLAGTGTIVFNGPGPYNALTLPYGGTLTIGSGITVEGANGYIGDDPQFGGPLNSMNVVNQGTILANVSGSSLVLYAGSWLNTGVLRVDSGGIVALEATYTNTGSTLSLDGSDGTFAFNGSIVGGTVSEADGATLQLDSGTLDGVVVDGDLQVEGEHGVTIQDGLTLNGTATLGGSGANNWGYFTFSGNQTLAGTGTIVFNGPGPYNALTLPYGGTLTIGSGITVEGANGYIGDDPQFGAPLNSMNVVNQGTILANVSGSSIVIEGGSFTNSGVSNAELGTISVATFGSGTGNTGTLSIGAGASISIEGTFVQSPNGNLNVVLGGAAAGQYGQLAVNGTATINGTLNVSEANGFLPTIGNNFTVVTFNSATGQFADYSGLILPTSDALEPTYITKNLTLATQSYTTVAPDLRVTNLAVDPVNPESGDNVTVNWDDANAGNGATAGSWTDHVVVVNADTEQTLLTADVPYDATTGGNLQPNSSTARSFNFQLPNGPAGVGNLQISVTVDSNKTVPESYPGGVGETNNTSTTTALSALAVYPDLQVSGLAIAQSSLTSGQALTVQWTDINSGMGITSGDWVDNITVVNATDGQTVASVNVPYNAADSGNIPAGGTSPQLSYTLTLPDGAAGVGSLQITVDTNADGQLYEYNSSGTASSNNTSTITTTSSLADYPDLAVANLAIHSPTSPQSGDTVTVAWDDQNLGDVAVNASFDDSVLVQRLNPDNSLTTIASGSLAGNGTLAIGGSSPQTFSFALPDGAAGAGNFVVTVTSDAGQTVREYDSSGNLAYANNTATVDFSSTVAVYPDLQVTQLAIGSGSVLQSGGAVVLDWNDANTGDAAASNPWNDQVTVVNTSTGQTLVNANVYNGAATTSPVAAGASVPMTFSFQLPEGAAGVGDLTISVTTDVDHTVFEYNSAGTGFTNNTSSITATSTLAAYPDLSTGNITAPDSVVPGQQLTVGWTLSNAGSAVANGPWTEQIFLASDSTGDNPILLGAFQYQGSLAPGQSVTRSAAVLVPNESAGNYWLVVSENALGEVFETDTTNNTAVAGQPTAIEGALTLSLANQSVSDGAGANATTGTVTINTSLSAPLVVTLNDSNPDVVVPPSVTIPAGQTSETFNIGTIDPDEVVGTQTATIVASANGLVGGSASLTVTDVNVPTLTVTLTSASVDEDSANPATSGTIARNTSTATPLVVSLVSNNVNKLTVPATVTIPAGQSSVNFPLAVLNDNQIDGNVAVVVTATSAGYVTGTATEIVIEDNAPTLNLTLGQTTVSEAGPNPATTGTVSIAGPATEPITVALTSSDTTAATVPATVVITTGSRSATFPITALDDGLDTGDKTAVITANIETNAGVILNQGSANASLLLREADGPALTISFPQPDVEKGAATTATVTRNTDTTNPLIVSLSSNDPTKASVPPTVTIPAGQTSVTFTVTAIDDHTPDGLQQVQIAVSATGLDTGLATLGIVDVDLPDLVVSNVSAPTVGYDNTPLSLSWTVTNNGQYPATGAWNDLIYFDPVGGPQSTSPVDIVTFTGTVNPGQNYTQTDTLPAPSTVGQYTVRVVTDANQSVQELSFSNNTGVAAQPLGDQALYQATVSTTATTVSNGTPVVLTGVATMTKTSAPAANVPVVVGILVDGTTRVLNATTDSNGHYSVTFQPLPNEAGNYSVTASDPGVTNPAVQAQFQIVGMSASPSSLTVAVVPNTPLVGQITLTDLSDTVLTDLTATTQGGPAGLTVQLTPPAQIAANGTATLSYTFTASASAASGPVVLVVQTAQGAVLDIPVNVTVVPATPQLIANPGTLSTGMVVGARTLITFSLTNDGGAPSGDLQVLLPATSYLSLASPATIPSLAPGASATVTLQLNPPSDLSLLQYTGTIAVSNSQTGLSVPFTFTAITTAVGNVHVLVDDDATFNVAGSPHVLGATVNLLNPYDNTQVVATGVTDATGGVTLNNVPAGQYVLQVEASGHATYQNAYTVIPGITNNDEIFIALQTVSYTWVVAQTTIQDTYQIQLQTTFDTNVPAPVITISAPASIPTLQPGQSGTFNVTITNHGLIAAQDLALELPSDPEYTFTALSAQLGTLPAGTLITVPIKVTRAMPQPVSTPDGGSVLTTRIEVPNPIGPGVDNTLYVDYSNTGTEPMPAPLLVLTANNDAFQNTWLTLNPALKTSLVYTTTPPAGYSQSVEILGSGATPGVLMPGESERVPVYYVGLNANPQFLPELSLKQIGPTPPTFAITTLNADNTTAANWPTLLAGAQPPTINNAAWATISANLESQLGTTSGGYVQLLDNEASYFGTIGEDVTDVQSLWGSAIQQADNALNPLAPFLASATDDTVATPGSLSLSFSRVFAESISGRDTMSTLGMGWSTSWQTSASVASNGTVTLTEPGGAQRIFEPSPSVAGHYLSQPGDTGKLTADGSGGYLLIEADGIETDYSHNGLLNYMQDTDGNRITAGYTSGRLTSLTASSGQYLDISYNAAGLISSVTDSSGRSVTYNYDPSSTYLVSVNGWNGQTTNYTYNTTAGSAAQNALQTITNPGGTNQFFTYDSLGRLTGISQNGGTEPVAFTFSYGRVNETDGTNDTTSTYYNENGLVAKTVDGLGNATTYGYDASFNLVKVTDPIGTSETATYNTAGEVTSSTDFLGNTTYFAYTGPFNKLSSLTDANGNTTAYGYNSSGDLLSTTFANGSVASSTFNPEGEATSFVDQNGEPINYTYNSAGLITQERFSDGSIDVYSYNVEEELLSATSAAGSITFTYDPAVQLLTQVTYPNGLYLRFTYNAAGQRTQMVDQTGFTVNYAYDPDGRLSELTDNAGNPIVTYIYDADGRLSLKTNGNGTYTSYQYDADGNVVHLINYAPGSSINSRFDYTYNSLGLETTESTLDGTWTYTYDADGQLTYAIFASTTPNVPSQDLAYSYDAMGNRTTTAINGVTNVYVSNDMNEYTSIDGEPYTYDANGNLISDGSETFSYNAQNQVVSQTTSAGVTSYTYDPLSGLSSSTQDGVTTQYLTDLLGDENVVGTFDSSGVATQNAFAPGLISEASSSGTYYPELDGLGSVVGLTDPEGSESSSINYVPFGGVLAVTQNLSGVFEFLGGAGVVSGVNGNNLMQARSYSSTLGRFIEPDPLGALGGSANVYQYGLNDPTQLSDPTGLAPNNFGIVPGTGIFQANRGVDAIGKLLNSPNQDFDAINNAIAQQNAIDQDIQKNGSVFPDAIGLVGKILDPAPESLIVGAAEDVGAAVVDPAGENNGGTAAVSGPCTVAIAANGSYSCGNNNVPIQAGAVTGVPGRNCTPQSVMAALSGVLNVGSPSTGGGGSIGLGGGGGNGGGTNSGGGSGGEGGSIGPSGGDAAPPVIESTASCNPVINHLNQQINQASQNAGDPPIDTSGAVTGSDEAADAAGPSTNESPATFIATVLGNLGLINGQNGNAGYSLANLAQMTPTIATFEQVEADIAGIVATASVNGGTIDVAGDINLLEQVASRLTAVTAAENLLFGSDANWLNTNQTATLQQWITAFFSDARDTSDGGETITAAERSQLLAVTLPSTVSTTEANEFLDRWNRTVQYWDEGIYAAAQVPAGQSTDFLDVSTLQSAFNAAVSAEETSQANGYSDPGAEIQGVLTQVQNDLSGQGVCATVKLQINQTASMTRSAFSGTLTLTNSEGTGAMTNVTMNITITDAQGNPANGQFFISSPSYSGAFSVVDGNATLPDNTTGSISFTFIPDNSAATNGATLYDIGGTIGFTDPAGTAVSIPVFPATISVFPSAQLQLNYFLQRDVFGDDPFTPQVEPSEPAVLGLLVTNVGQGNANNLTITTAQPEILQNQKGLPDNFQIIGTQVGTQQESPSLTADLGTIEPGQTTDADFLLTSPVQGIFTDFSATFTHTDALGGLDTSLISSIQTHTLIHAGDFNFPGNTGEIDYLAEDSANLGNLPDTVYLSNGATAPVNIATNAQAVADSAPLTYTVTANVTSGWDYVQLPDPGAGFTLSSVVRSDGTAIPVSDMAWTTDRTFDAAGNAAVDHELHILDLDSTGSYTVTYSAVHVTPPTSSVASLPAFSAGTTFTVNWSGSGGSGPLAFSVYASDNGGPFTPWLVNTSTTQAAFHGTIGHTYSFYSIAADSNGDVQSTPSGAQAITTVGLLSPSIVVSDAGGTFNGSPSTATATATGVGGSTVDGTFAFTYFDGTTATGTGFSTAPTAAGTYTVVATFTSSDPDYASEQSAPVTFTIAHATPTVSVNDAGDHFDGNPFVATALVAGVVPGVDNTAGPSLEGISPTVTYYAGSTASGDPLATAPIAAGTYTVVASFPGNDDYLSANSSLTFTISPATPTVVATDAGGPFTGQPFPATATATGVNGAAVNGTFAFTYYVGSVVNGTGTSTPPTNAGTYTVVATFSSADPNYTGNQSAPVTFVIASIAVSAPPSIVLNENGSVTFSTASGNPIALTDTNAGTNKTESLTLSVAHGSLTLGSTTGLSFKAGKNKSASFTVTGTLASLNAALNGLTYTPTTVYWGADSLAIMVQDAGDGLSASSSVAITINPLSPPTITAPASAMLSENLSVTFSTALGNAISLADANAGTSETLTLAVTNGTLTLGATPGLTFKSGKNGAASFSIAATLANLNTALNGLTYKPTSGYSGPDTLSISALNTADGRSSSSSVALIVTPAIAPSITAPSSALLNENSSLVFSTANSNAISFADANAGTSKTESLTLTVAHGALKLATTSGLTVTAGANNSASLSVTGTVGNLNAALAGLTYKPTTAYWGTDLLAITVQDAGDGLSASNSIALTVNPLSPPTITAPVSATLGENLSVTFSTALGNAISLGDANAANGETLTLSVTNGTLTLGATPGLTFKSGKNGTASFSIAATLANLNTALNGLTYKPSSGYSGPDTLSISALNTADGRSSSSSVALTVTPATAPVIIAPSSVSLNENGSLVFSASNNNAISFSDANAGTSKTESLTLAVTHGTLQLATMTGLTVTAGANKSASMTVTGTLASLNAALGGLIYKPATGYSGSDVLAISLSDPGTNLSATQDVQLTVATSAPSISAPPTATVAENGSLVFSTANGNLINVADVNAGTSLQQMTLTSTEGSIQTGTTTGITFVAGRNKSSSMTLSGTLAALNNALKGLSFTAAPGFSESAAIDLSYTDLSNGLTASAAIAITIGNAAPMTVTAGLQQTNLSPTSVGLRGAVGAQTTAIDLDDVTDQWAGFAEALDVLNG